MLKINAENNPPISKPLSNHAAIIKIIALIKSKKIPKVNIVIGIVRKINIGLINTFNKDTTIAANIAVG